MSAYFQIKDGKPLWLCLYAQEAAQQQQQHQQPQQPEKPDVASFLSSFAARARQGWNEQQQQTPSSGRRIICVPSAAAVAWRDEILQGLKKWEYTARPSVWISPLRPIGETRNTVTYGGLLVVLLPSSAYC